MKNHSSGGHLFAVVAISTFAAGATSFGVLVADMASDASYGEKMSPMENMYPAPYKEGNYPDRLPSPAFDQNMPLPPHEDGFGMPPPPFNDGRFDQDFKPPFYGEGMDVRNNPPPFMGQGQQFEEHRVPLFEQNKLPLPPQGEDMRSAAPYGERDHAGDVHILPYPDDKKIQCEETRRGLADFEMRVRKYCESGSSEECRRAKDEFTRTQEKMQNCEGYAQTVNEQSAPFPETRPTPLGVVKPVQVPSLQRPLYREEPGKVPVFSEQRPMELDCGSLKEKLNRVRDEAQVVCSTAENDERCLQIKRMAEDIARGIEQCGQGMQYGRTEDRQLMPPPQPWQEGQYPGNPAQGRPFEEHPMPPMQGNQPPYGQMPMPQDGTMMPPPIPMGMPGEDGSFQRGMPEQHMDEMVEKKFFMIINEANRRLYEALQFIDDATAADIKEVIGWIEDLAGKFEKSDAHPTRDDIERLVQKLEGVKRSMDEKMRNRSPEDNQHAEKRGPGQDQWNDNSSMQQNERESMTQRPPRRNTDEIVGELSTIFENMIPRVFEIFGEEGEVVPSEARNAYKEANSAFQSVKPICEGGEVKRRVCGAALQEVFMILEEDMKPFIEERMMQNEHLRKRIEELFGEKENDHDGQEF